MAPKKREASTSTPVFVAGWLQRVVVCATTESSDISSDEEEKEKHVDISFGGPRSGRGLIGQRGGATCKSRRSRPSGCWAKPYPRNPDKHMDIIGGPRSVGGRGSSDNENSNNPDNHDWEHISSVVSVSIQFYMWNVSLNHSIHAKIK